MALFLIYILSIQQHSKTWLKGSLQLLKISRMHFHTYFLIFLYVLSLSFSILTKAQNSSLHYKIMRGGNDIGNLQLEKKNIGNKSNLLLTSEIKTHLFVSITVSVKESAIFENGKMIFSSQFRKTNGVTKLDKETHFVTDKYVVTENGEKEKLNFTTIESNVLSLYFNEPINLQSAYSDKQQCYFKVIKMKDGGYKIKFPDGNMNSFYYQDGVCTKVKITNPFYSIDIIQKE